jgi:hypothetical protein
MVREQVWVEDVEVIRVMRRNENGDVVYIEVPGRKKWLGRCEATPEAVARLAEVAQSIASEALSTPGEAVLILEHQIPPMVVRFYLVVYPS